MPTKVIRRKTRKKIWKSIPRSRAGKTNKLALGALGVLLGIVILAWSINFIHSLFSPYRLPDIKSSDKTFSGKKYLWDGQYNINLIVRTENISLFNFNPRDATITFINIPDETFLEAPFELGRWQLRALYELGQSQQIGGGELLKNTLTPFFGIPFDGFLDLTDAQIKTPAQMVESLRKNIFSGYSLLSGIKTDLSMWELFKLKQGVDSVRFDKIQELNLEELNVLQKETLADGTPVLTADPQILDSVLTDLKDPNIIAEHKTIAVLNATEKPQLAQKWARLITNLGGNVIITGNAEERIQKTKVLGEPSQTLKRLRQIFSSDVKISPSEDNLTSTRAQITILLGEDYTNR